MTGCYDLDPRASAWQMPLMVQTTSSRNDVILEICLQTDKQQQTEIPVLEVEIERPYLHEQSAANRLQE